MHPLDDVPAKVLLKQYKDHMNGIAVLGTDNLNYILDNLFELEKEVKPGKIKCKDYEQVFNESSTIRRAMPRGKGCTLYRIFSIVTDRERTYKNWQLKRILKKK